MQVQTSASYPNRPFFFVGGRAVAPPQPPAPQITVAPLGVVVIKQTISTTGAPMVQENVRLADLTYQDPTITPAANELAVQFESDVVPFKEWLDVIVVRPSRIREQFGTFSVDRGPVAGAARPLWFGWRDRTTIPRVTEAGDALHFARAVVTDPANPPPLVDRLRLPTGFTNRFYNGGQNGDQAPGALNPPAVSALLPLTGGDTVHFTATAVGSVSGQVTIPPAPSLAMTGVTTVPPITVLADTVVYVDDGASRRFLVTWRCRFPWSAALEAPTARLMVA